MFTLHESDVQEDIELLTKIEHNLIKISLKASDLKIKELSQDSLIKIQKVKNSLNEWNKNEDI